MRARQYPAGTIVIMGYLIPWPTLESRLDSWQDKTDEEGKKNGIPPRSARKREMGNGASSNRPLLSLPFPLSTFAKTPFAHFLPAQLQPTKPPFLPFTGSMHTPLPLLFPPLPWVPAHSPL
jgi:hypothetical protein